MTTNNIDEIGRDIANSFNQSSLKNKILDGIKVATEKMGIKLIKGEWARKEKSSSIDCACALGCVLMANNLDVAEEDASYNEEAAAKFLNVDSTWIHDFISGYDGGSSIKNYLNKDTLNAEAFGIGSEIRAQYLEKILEEDYDEDEDVY